MVGQNLGTGGESSGLESGRKMVHDVWIRSQMPVISLHIEAEWMLGFKSSDDLRAATD